MTTEPPLVCTECGGEIPPHTSYIAGIKHNGKIEFSWACTDHHRVTAEVMLASNHCTVKFTERCPEHVHTIMELLKTRHRHGH